jgi:type IV pilus assembly protein PilO
MAASGFMADFARMPRDRKILVFAVSGLLLGAVYWQFGYKGAKEALEEADGTHESLVAKSKALDGDIPKYQKLKEKDQELKKIIDENQKALPTEAELPAFFDTLSRKVKEAGVEVSKWSYKPEIQVDAFIKVPVDVEMTGTFLQIKRFFASLIQSDIAPASGAGGVSDAQAQERDRIVSIENLSLTKPTVRNHEIVLSAHFVAATFRQEAPAVPAAAPGAPGAGSGAAAPTGPTLPPPPSAATPAGAKAKTEDALKKGETRNGNAAGVDEAKTGAGSAGVDRLKKGM